MLDPLDATIRQVITLYCPVGCDGHQFWRKTASCGVVQLLYEANFQKAQNGSSTQLIKVTSSVYLLNTTIGAEDFGKFSSYQMLTIDKNW
jgi:hypothetical protein